VPDAALRIHRDAPRMVPPEGEERAKSGPAWVRDDLWLYRVRSLRSQSFPFIVSLREFSFLAGARRPPPAGRRYITYRVSAFNFARYPRCDRRLCEVIFSRLTATSFAFFCNFFFLRNVRCNSCLCESQCGQVSLFFNNRTY